MKNQILMDEYIPPLKPKNRFSTNKIPYQKNMNPNIRLIRICSAQKNVCFLRRNIHMFRNKILHRKFKMKNRKNGKWPQINK